MSPTEICLRFLVGGAVVSFFSLVGEALKPKTLAGLFSSAPSVAIATLALTFTERGRAYVTREAHAMLLGVVGLVACDIAFAAMARRHRFPMWLGAVLSWAVWAMVTFVAMSLDDAGVRG